MFITVVEALIEAGFAKSRGEAHRIIRGGGAKVDGFLIEEDHLIPEEEFTIFAGKKKSARIVEGKAVAIHTNHPSGNDTEKTFDCTLLKKEQAEAIVEKLKTVEAVAPSEHHKLWKDHKSAVERIKSLEDDIEFLKSLGPIQAAVEKKIQNDRIREVEGMALELLREESERQVK